MDSKPSLKAGDSIWIEQISQDFSKRNSLQDCRSGFLILDVSAKPVFESKQKSPDFDCLFLSLWMMMSLVQKKGSSEIDRKPQNRKKKRYGLAAMYCQPYSGMKTVDGSKLFSKHKKAKRKAIAIGWLLSA